MHTGVLSPWGNVNTLHEENKSQSITTPPSVHTSESYNKILESPLLFTSLLQPLTAGPYDEARELDKSGYDKLLDACRFG